ncbi:prepilin peptidase [Nesterenkonia alba]|uniref:prepilin peptidase n=1 Tax=Nesterenkonia alba TaxID=515814 RepID=UPI0003B49D03|nr:A24 family peptidase [Nesterenkonia alba]
MSTSQRLLAAGVALASVTLVVVATEPTLARFALLLLAVVGPFLAAVDIQQRCLPDVMTLPLAAGCGTLLTVTALLDGDLSRGLVALACGVGSVGFFFLLHLRSPGELGFGDVKLMLSLGPLLGWQGVTATLLGIMAGLVSALILGGILILTGRGSRRSHLALGPHLILGAFVAGLLTY